MLRGVVFKRSLRSFAAGCALVFRPGVNLLVGDNGVGKSTLISLLRALSTDTKQAERRWRSIEWSKEDAAGILMAAFFPPIRALGYDFERDSGRVANEAQEDLASQLFDMRHSHGEASRAMLASLDTIAERFVAFLDEPDANLSPRAAYELVRLFRRLATKGHQIVASVHNPILILGTIPSDDTPSAWPEVLSLEHDDWMPAAAFLATHAHPRKEG